MTEKTGLFVSLSYSVAFLFRLLRIFVGTLLLLIVVILALIGLYVLPGGYATTAKEVMSTAWFNRARNK